MKTVDLALLLSHTAHSLTTELAAELAALGITPRAHCVLSKAAAGDHTQNRLAELCDLDKTTMVVTIDELERAGLAVRRLSRTDRRARIIGVTKAGERVLAQANEIVERINDDVLASLPARERKAFVEGLARLAGGRLAVPVTCERPVRRPRSAV